MTAVQEDTAGLLGLSDERDVQLKLRQRAYTEGWEAGHVAGVGDGRQAEGTERDQRWNAIARPVARGGQAHAEIELKRWIVRGSPRTRATFGQPHPDDHSGGPVAAW